MSKRILGWAAAICLICTVSSVQAQMGSMNFAFVDLDTVFTNFYKTKLANNQIQEQVEEFVDERTELVTTYESMQADYKDMRDKALNTALSEEVRAEMRRDAEEKLIEMRDQESKIRRFNESTSRKIEEQKFRMRTRIVEEIQEKLQEYSKSQGYMFVLDTSGVNMNGVSSVIYYDERYDITEDVITLLNK